LEEEFQEHMFKLEKEWEKTEIKTETHGVSEKKDVFSLL
jgi:hypothetical protein